MDRTRIPEFGGIRQHVAIEKAILMPPSDKIKVLIERSNVGDDSARRELFDLIYDRFQGFARKMLRGFPGVKRWEQTDDVWQNAGLKLWQSLERVHLKDTRHFHALAAMHVRRELIELTRHYFGPLGLGANAASEPPAGQGDKISPLAPDDQTDTYEAGQLAIWTEFHSKVEQLPPEEREIFDLIWYQGLPQADAAEIIGVSTRTVKRRWQSARLHLSTMMSEQLPE